jgi:hypothetical protein
MSNGAAPQSFQNHTKFFPMFHFFVLPILAINLIRAIVVAVRAFSWSTAFGVLFALALVALALASRLMALTVQDRVIRMEMWLRLQSVLPADLKPRIPEFTRDQLVAMRFASDGELPTLARKVLDERLGERKAIKQLVQNWQPDHLRA